MVPVQLICSDIDGTLLNKDRELSKETISAIKGLNTIPFVLISSRMPKAMVHLQNQLSVQHLPLIAYNGGLIIQDDVVLHSTEIDIKTVENICDFCSSTSLHTSLYHNNEWHVDKFDYWAQREKNNTKVHPNLRDNVTTVFHWKNENKGAHKIMCMGFPKEIDGLETFLKKYAKEVVGYRSKPTYLEISPRKVNKQTAVSTLLDLKYPDIDLNQVMAFGDNYNDIEMLHAVGIGVAVDNAVSEAKKVANHITLSNKEHGVSHFLQEYFN